MAATPIALMTITTHGATAVASDNDGDMDHVRAHVCGAHGVREMSASIHGRIGGMWKGIAGEFTSQPVAGV